MVPHNLGASVVLEGHDEVLTGRGAVAISEDEELSRIDRLRFFRRVFVPVVEVESRIIAHINCPERIADRGSLNPVSPRSIHETAD